MPRYSLVAEHPIFDGVHAAIDNQLCRVYLLLTKATSTLFYALFVHTVEGILENVLLIRVLSEIRERVLDSVYILFKKCKNAQKQFVPALAGVAREYVVKHSLVVVVHHVVLVEKVAIESGFGYARRFNDHIDRDLVKLIFP